MRSDEVELNKKRILLNCGIKIIAVEAPHGASFVWKIGKEVGALASTFFANCDCNLTHFAESPGEHICNEFLK